jgi:hypothetical protein
MATARIYVECDVCGTITVLRLQIGWLDWHPIRIPCGNCQIVIYGKAIFDHQNIDFKVEFENAKTTNEKIPSFYLETSGELITSKLQRFYDGIYYKELVPFIRASQEVGLKEYPNFQEKSLRFLSSIKTAWPKIRRINELWIAEQYDYLESDLEKNKYNWPELPEVPTRKLHLLRTVHLVNRMFLEPLVWQESFSKATQLALDGFGELNQNKPVQMRAFAADFSRKGLLKRYERKLLECMMAFVDKVNFLLPAFSLEFYKDRSRAQALSATMGITTVAFTDLKELFIDLFEVAADIARLVVALNNIKHRGKFREMNPIRKDIVNLEDWDAKKKGNRIEYLTKGETFDIMLSEPLDNQLRNAIGHSTFQFDGVNQIVVYYPDGEENIARKRTIPFIDFVRKCWRLSLDVLFNLGELVYQARKLEIITQ